MALKQGFGRLIRKVTDTGIAVMLDDRLLRSPMLLKSFPDGVEPKAADADAIIAVLAEQAKLLMNK
jgi:Rad3-related DNA helicase